VCEACHKEEHKSEKGADGDKDKKPKKARKSIK